ncbi:MAG TPA: hypothetical protein VN799_00055 [Acidimicrobiales bacterium]|nr:hypothetical protein [Acidimicrobiales bacterium]
MFPKWLNKLFPVDPDEPAPEWGRHTADEGGVSSTTFGASDIAGLRTKIVCHACNTGWMSKLEARAEPVLTPMVSGEPVTLDRDQQVLVATWATKTAMVFEPTLTNLDPFTEEQCSIVRTQDHPPGSTVIYLGAVEGPIAPMGYWCAKVHLVLGDSPFRNYHFHTLHVGPLVMHVLRMEPPPSGYGSFEAVEVPREVDISYDLATKIFLPTGNAPWPPKRVLGWNGLVALTRRELDMPEEWTPPGPHWAEESRDS